MGIRKWGLVLLVVLAAGCQCPEPIYVVALNPNSCRKCGTQGAQQIFLDGRRHATNRTCPKCQFTWMCVDGDSLGGK